MNMSVSSLVLMVLLVLFLFLVINGTTHMFMREGMKNKGKKKRVVEGKKSNRKVEKLPF